MEIKKVKDVSQLRSLSAESDRDKRFKMHFLEGAAFSEHVYGYYIGEKLAGFISFTKYQDDSGGIDYLYVDSKYRKKGIGRKLIEFASNFMNVHKVWVDPLDEQVQCYYQSLGFHPGKHDALIKLIS